MYFQNMKTKKQMMANNLNIKNIITKEGNRQK